MDNQNNPIPNRITRQVKCPKCNNVQITDAVKGCRCKKCNNIITMSKKNILEVISTSGTKIEGTEADKLEVTDGSQAQAPISSQQEGDREIEAQGDLTIDNSSVKEKTSLAVEANSEEEEFDNEDEKPEVPEKDINTTHPYECECGARLTKKGFEEAKGICPVCKLRWTNG